jgi:phage gp29-like protein
MSKHNKKRRARQFAESDANTAKPAGPSFVSEENKSELRGLARTPMSIESYLNILPNPDDVLRKAALNLSEYEKLLYDGHVYACIQSRLSGVASSDWDVDRDKDPTLESEFIKDWLWKLNVPNTARDLWQAVLYGYAPCEVYWEDRFGYKLESELLNPEQINSLLQRDFFLPGAVRYKPSWHFEFDKYNMLRIKDASLSSDDAYPPRKKFLVTQYGAYSFNPYGRGILSQCFWPVQFKKGNFKFWTEFLEKYTKPYVITQDKDDAEISRQADIEDMINVSSNLRGGGTAHYPAGVDVSFPTAGEKGSADAYKEAILFLNAEISKAILSQTLTTEQGESGARAMSETHFKVFENVITSDKRMIEEKINELIRWVIEFNFPDCERVPEFKFYENEDLQIDRAERDMQLFNQGVRFSKDYYKTYGLNEDQYEVADISSQPQQGMPGSQFAEEDNLFELVEKEATKDLVKANNLVISRLLKKLGKETTFEG